jgi:DNA replication protein DnaC
VTFLALISFPSAVTDLVLRRKNNPVLIGEPGVGKTSIAEGLAQRIVNRDVPASLIARLFSLDMGALMAGKSILLPKASLNVLLTSNHRCQVQRSASFFLSTSLPSLMSSR